MQKRNNKQKFLNVFEGRNSALDFLNPDNAPYTPLVEIPDNLNPYRKDGVRVFAKLLNMLPLANIKSLPAYNMLLKLKDSGPMPDTIIENSSGNTVFSLAVIARLLGIQNTKAIVSHEISPGKLNMLRFLGTEVMVNEEPICPDPSDPTSGIYKAKILSKEHGWFNPSQYDNEANPDAHQKWTGPQIWKQTEGKISLLSVGLGTTGSAVGIGKYLKKKNSKIEIIGVSRTANNPVPGVRTNNLLKEIAFDWKSILDHKEEAGTVESFRMSMKLCRSGLFVGPSSGFALVGLYKHLSKQKFTYKEKIAVFVCPDSPFLYIDEYFQYLNPSEFPTIQNEQLLSEKNHPTTSQNSDIIEFSAEEVFNLIFKDTLEKVWKKIEGKENLNLNKDVTIIDIRNSSDFEDHHIPESINIPFKDLNNYLTENENLFSKNKTVIFVCKHGNTSRLATSKANQLGINSISLQGGTVEWSRLNFPRIRSDKCIFKFDLQNKSN